MLIRDDAFVMSCNVFGFNRLFVITAQRQQRQFRGINMGKMTKIGNSSTTNTEIKFKPMTTTSSEQGKHN